MNVLEINVSDTIIACETLQETTETIDRIVRAWFASDDTSPLVITLNKIEDRGPPTLEINVLDGVTAKGGLV